MITNKAPLSDQLFEDLESKADYWTRWARKIDAQGREWTDVEKQMIRLVAERQDELRDDWQESRWLEGKGPRPIKPVRMGVYAKAGEHLPEIFMYGVFGETIIAADFAAELSRFSDTEPIAIRVHSEGGIYTEGVAVQNLIRSRRGPVHAYVDGLAASAASSVLMPCATITMAHDSYLMIHYCNASLQYADADTLEEKLRRMREVDSAIVDNYMVRWRRTREELHQALKEETWFNATESIAVGLADYVGERAAIAARVRTDTFQNAPASIGIAARANTDSVRTNLASLVLHRLDRR